MRTRARLLPGLALAAALLLAGCGAAPSADQGGADGAGGRDPEATAPKFSFETFEGETFSLAEQRGTPVVLNFWESW